MPEIVLRHDCSFTRCAFFTAALFFPCGPDFLERPVDSGKINGTLSARYMDRNYGVKIIFLGIEIVVAKIIDHDRFAVRTHDPVLLHACILILVKLEK